MGTRLFIIGVAMSAAVLLTFAQAPGGRQSQGALGNRPGAERTPEFFGKDSYQPDEFPYFWRTFETADEYFDYYRDYHAYWKLYGLNLPDAVLRKLYYQNALKLLPGMSRTGFPD